VSTSLAAFDVFEMNWRHMMSVDPEAALAELGARWNSSIPHVQPDEAIDLVASAPGAAQQDGGHETMPRRRSRAWLLGAAAALVAGLIGGLIMSAGRGSDHAVSGPTGVEDRAADGVDGSDHADQPPLNVVDDEVLVSNRSPVVIGDEFATALLQPLDQLGFEVDDQGVESSGLARPSFYDWPSNLTAILDDLPAGTPVVATFGGNDSQVLVRADETIVAKVDDPQWAAEYRDRVDAVMSQITSAGHPLVWVGAPPPPDRLRAALGEIRFITIQVAAANDQVTYVDTWDILERQSIGDSGSAELQSPDEYHLSEAGGRVVAAEVAAVLEGL
jgi:hypothetical protein